MKFIRSLNNNPYFNLAAEEYLLKKFSEDFYFQYVNAPSVVIGKHQNALAEIDLDYLRKNDILLARRISGGGAVFHDKGNVNYSFITNEVAGDFVKFKKYTAPVIDILGRLGIEATMGKRNEILVGQEKISGTASHVFKTRVIHHGTLLYNTNLKVLAKCLYVNSDRYRDKAVKSVRSKVVNIKELLESPLSSEGFYEFLFSSMMDFFKESHEMIFSNEDIVAIEALMDEKFRFWEWNFGYSPKYVVENELTMGLKQFTIITSVSKGIIESVQIKDSQADPVLTTLEMLLPGTKHHKQDVDEKLSRLISDMQKRQVLLKGLF